MPVVTVDLTANRDTVRQPIIWRVGRRFNVVTNLKRARISGNYGHASVTLEGSTEEVAQAQAYLSGLGLTGEAEATAADREKTEDGIEQPNTILVSLSTVNPTQGHAPLLYRIGRDFNVVVNIEKGAFDEDEGGALELTISGALSEVQRAIAYLHTTGLHVNPRQRSVTDYGNL